MAKKKVMLTVAAAAALMMGSPAINKAEAATTTTSKVYVYQYSNMDEFNRFLEQIYARYGLAVPKMTGAEQGASQTHQPVQKETVQPSQQPTAKQEPAPSPQKPAPTQTTNSLSAYEQKVVDLTNQERAKNGLPGLKVDVELSKMAHEKSRDMSTNSYFDHTSPTYGSPFDMMKQYGISYRYAGENIAMGQKTPEEVVKAWMNSEGHRKNILSPNFTHIGVGYVSQGNYWTQEFIGK
ncbi:CAP domain-containing protein [Neobacillus mesonae]|uniref:CAP domain-containing protein n=1 Tax=Neobacillus mesonae TaxID=1193713 RepID=UPI00082A5FD3|nr:CAP domain-containing protein [Neobacillus mesonae]